MDLRTSAEIDSPIRLASLWETMEGGRVQCHLCPYTCKIAEGKLGTCGVRQNRGGSLFTLIYGSVSSAAADPVEKKPLYHFYPGSRVYSVGTVGCNFRCIHCQNWQISRAEPLDAEALGARYMSPEALVEEAVAHGCSGVAWTYNEPTIWMEYAFDSAVLAKERGLYTVFVTNGYITREGLDHIGPYLDAYRVDLKGIFPDTLKAISGVKNPEPVLASSVRAKNQWGMHVEMVTNVIPGMNDSEEELRAMARWMVSELGADTPWHVTRFFPSYKLVDRGPTPVETLRRARDIGREEGLRYVYEGNVIDGGGADTICPSCGAVVVSRTGYGVDMGGLAPEGTCVRCGTGIPMVHA